MNKYKFRRSVGSFSLLVAILMTILAMIFSIISNSYGNAAAAGGVYKVSYFGMVITFCVLSIVLIAVAYYMDGAFEGKLFSVIADILILVSAAFLVACISVMISSRGDLMGYIWFSDLEKGNPDAINALYMALVSWIFYLLAIVALAVAAAEDFCEKGAKENRSVKAWRKS